MGLMCLITENEAAYVPGNAVVYSPAIVLDSMLKIFLAASGFGTVKIVREFDSRVTTSVVTEPPVVIDDRERTAFSPTINTEVLSALAPYARVEIGSLIAMFPSTRWRVDGGGSIVNWGKAFQSIASAQVSKPLAKTPKTIVNQVSSNPPPDGPNGSSNVHVYLGVVPDVFTRGLSRFSARVSSVDGVKLKDGDIVKDADGTVWRYNGSTLTDRIQASVSSKNMKSVDNGAAIAPRKASDAHPANYVPAALYELKIAWSASESSQFAAESFPEGGAFGRTWGWRVFVGKPTVEHARGRCQGEFGAALDRATPELCVQDGGTWDRPCETDTECPFYDSRRGRGGCSEGGFCEMPLGVDRRSFRMPGDTSGSMRHGCPASDPDYPRCSRLPASSIRFANEALN